MLEEVLSIVLHADRSNPVVTNLGPAVGGHERLGAEGSLTEWFKNPALEERTQDDRLRLRFQRCLESGWEHVRSFIMVKEK
jgi:hypothetical protein